MSPAQTVFAAGTLKLRASRFGAMDDLHPLRAQLLAAQPTQLTGLVLFHAVGQRLLTMPRDFAASADTF
ncbi:MAG: hypothetical protein ACYCSN_11835 [Acidobacteriaceae bacterium]